MIFAKVDVNIPWHPRFVRIPSGIQRSAAIGLWMAALCYTRGHELDGFCPLDSVATIATPETVEWLIKVGLFERVEVDGVPGVIVLKYAEHNETKQEIAERRRLDSERKKKRNPDGFRSGLQQSSTKTPAVRPDSDSGSDSGSENGSGSVPTKLPPGVVTHEVAFWIAAYEVGASRARGFPFTFPKTEWRFADTMADLVAKHCVDKTRVSEWWDKAAFEFLRAVGGDDKWRHGFGPKGMLEWWNEGRPGYTPPTPPRPKSPTPTADAATTMSAEARAEQASRIATLVTGIGRGAA